jgi:hypothetical protein
VLFHVNKKRVIFLGINGEPGVILTIFKLKANMAFDCDCCYCFRHAIRNVKSNFSFLNRQYWLLEIDQNKTKWLVHTLNLGC